MSRVVQTSFENVRFTNEVINMFADLIADNEPTLKVIFYILKNHKNDKPTTIQDIVDNVKVIRRVAKRKGKKVIGYEMAEAPLDRKTAERIVDRLYYMTLISIEEKLPFKQLYISNRGDQVINELANRLK